MNIFTILKPIQVSWKYHQLINQTNIMSRLKIHAWHLQKPIEFFMLNAVIRFKSLKSGFRFCLDLNILTITRLDIGLRAQKLQS